VTATAAMAPSVSRTTLYRVAPGAVSPASAVAIKAASAGSTYAVTAPPAPSPAAASGDPRLTEAIPGHLEVHANSISARYQNANLVDVLMGIFDATGTNCVISPEVTGTVTCSFKDLPMIQVIESILKGANLDSSHKQYTYEIENDIWYIRPKTD
jgi:type II secretory pathway component HofQ